MTYFTTIENGKLFVDIGDTRIEIESAEQFRGIAGNASGAMSSSIDFPEEHGATPEIMEILYDLGLRQRPVAIETIDELFEAEEPPADSFQAKIDELMAIRNLKMKDAWARYDYDLARAKQFREDALQAAHDQMMAAADKLREAR